MKHPVLRGHPLHAILSDLPATLIPCAFLSSVVADASGRREPEVEDAAGVATEAGETILFTSPELTVSRLVWAPGMRMYPHDHGVWTVIGVCRGAERNILHRRSVRGGLDDVGIIELRAGDVSVLDDDVIHSVVNPVEELSVALHVFGGDLRRQSRSEWDVATHEERPYDDDRVQRLFDTANALSRRR